MGNETKFALRFEDGNVEFLISNLSGADWKVLNHARIESDEISTEMDRFCKRVTNETGNAKVAVFLSESDIHHSEVSVLGRSQASQLSHVKRTLARRLKDRADNIVADLGKQRKGGTSAVVFALHETLENAQEFLGSFGLEARYFSTLKTVPGFAVPPRLLEKIQPKKTEPSFVKRAIRGAFYGTSTAMATGVVFLVGLNNLSPSYATTVQIQPGTVDTETSPTYTPLNYLIHDVLSMRVTMNTPLGSVSDSETPVLLDLVEIQNDVEPFYFFNPGVEPTVPLVGAVPLTDVNIGNAPDVGREQLSKQSVLPDLTSDVDWQNKQALKDLGALISTSLVAPMDSEAKISLSGSSLTAHSEWTQSRELSDEQLAFLQSGFVGKFEVFVGEVKNLTLAKPFDVIISSRGEKIAFNTK
jgi:hypothetical protein